VNSIACDDITRGINVGVDEISVSGCHDDAGLKSAAAGFIDGSRNSGADGFIWIFLKKTKAKKKKKLFSFFLFFFSACVSQQQKCVQR
jgi:hypothetical protein